MDPEIVAAIIGPALTAMLAASAVAIRAWWARRSLADRQERAITRATQQVVFTDAWLAAYEKAAGAKELGEHRARAVRDLDRAYAEMQEAVAAERRMSRAAALASPLRTALLLGLRRPAAKVLRVVYYVLAPFSVLFFLAGMGSLVDTGREDLLVGIGSTMLFTLLVFFPAALVWLLARLLDRPRREPSGTGLGPAPAAYNPIPFGPSSPPPPGGPWSSGY